IYLLLLIPGIIMSTFTLDIGTNVRKAIVFNIIGPICLAVCSIYCYQRKMTQSQMDNVLLAMSFPIITTITYMYLYTPSVKEVVTGTSSNFETSGGYGPNQVSTILGLGIFLFFVRTIFYSRNKLLLLINVLLLCVVTFRGIVTFSRGGVLTAGIMIILLIVKLSMVSTARGKSKLLLITAFATIGLICVWTYSSYQTSGMIDKRYANEDQRGRQKVSKLSGREVLIETELQMFLDNPILGIGVGKNREYREELTGINAASHNEITRMLAEHGTLGIFALLILFFTPIILSSINNQHLYLFSFVIFWLLTINHAAMRLAAPAFIYALSLLKIESFEKPALHRK
ncbi:O-antigen ligase, partial [uncultured Flavobacterium sp.]|uniref:O-antigen ligase family protein n=1 Tax=uncultured Flavobacterium sp. TaxID=165435 RepID=UPI0025F16588